MSETATAAAPVQEPAAAAPVATAPVVETKPAAAAPVETKPVAAEPAKPSEKPIVSTTKPSILSTAGKPAATATDPAKPVVEAGKEVAKEGAVKTEGEPAKPVVPEKYEVKAPDGITLDEAMLEKFTPIAKELGLSNEQVQKLADFQATQIVSAQAAQKQAFETFVQQTEKETIDFYGNKLDAELIDVAKGRDQFADQAVLDMLEATGLASHKSFIGMFGRIGRAISEHKLVEGKTAVAEDTRTDGQVIYAKDKK
jgi:hypothetical protein